MAPLWYMLYIAVLYTGSLGTIGTGILVHIREKSSFSKLFLMLSISAFIYTFGYGMELTSRTAEAVIFWDRFQYLGISFIGTLHFLLIVYFATSEKRINRLFVGCLLTFSVFLLVASQTNHWHSLHYENIEILNSGRHLLLVVEKGVLYHVMEAYVISAAFSSMLILAFFCLRVPGAFRKQAWYIIAGAVAFIAVEAMVMTGLLHPPVDVLPLTVLINALLFGLAVFRHRLISLVPVAREYVLEMMSDAVVVVDHYDMVADANPLALRVFAVGDAHPVGRRLEDAFPMLSSTMPSKTRIDRDGRAWEARIQKITRKAGAFIGKVIIINDVTEREELVSRLKDIARIDALTGLLNRRSWQAAVSMEMEKLARHKRPATLIYLDLDHFKRINDTYGHSEGDRILRKTAEILTGCVRHPDMVGRLGGEEFGLFLPESGQEDGTAIAERLRRELQQYFQDDVETLADVTGSFGVAGDLITQDTCLNHLISLADKAMYRSKRKGRNKVSVSKDVPIKRADGIAAT